MCSVDLGRRWVVVLPLLAFGCGSNPVNHRDAGDARRPDGVGPQGSGGASARGGAAGSGGADGAGGILGTGGAGHGGAKGTGGADGGVKSTGGASGGRIDSGVWSATGGRAGAAGGSGSGLGEGGARSVDALADAARDVTPVGRYDTATTEPPLDGGQDAAMTDGPMEPRDGAPGEAGIADRPVACSGHGRCTSNTCACLCDLGYGGSDCGSCAEGFVAQPAGSCGLPADGTSDVWPNDVSKANSDPWLAVHHDQITQIRPKILALNFANPNAQPQPLLDAIFAAFAQASRPQGYRDAGASPQLAYQLVKIVDLRDGVDGRPAAPANYPYDNSTLYPVTGARPLTYTGSPPDFGSFDYAALFSASFAKHYGFADAAHPGQYLDLCGLVERGELNDLWVIASGDKPDGPAAEVLETKPVYTSTGNRVPGASERCAGNGCFAADVPFCGRSLRIGLVNYNRGPGCYMESLSHGLEWAMNHQVAPALSEWFTRFAGFDLATRYGLPFDSWYGLGCNSPPCLSYPTQTSARIVTPSLTRTLDPFDAVCGNVHFPPNGQRDYDIDNPATVQSSCADFGKGSGATGADALAALKSSDWMTPYRDLASDCDGPFLVWWWQNMPAHGSGKRFADGRSMKSVWPFLYY